MRFRLRTLLIVLAIGPPILGLVYIAYEVAFGRVILVPRHQVESLKREAAREREALRLRDEARQAAERQD